MLFLFFDCLIAGVSIYTLKNFSRGFIAMFCMTIAMPWMVQMKLGRIYMTYMDFFCVLLPVAMFVHIIVKHNKLNRSLTQVVLFDLFTSFLLIICSSRLVPLDFQISSFVKKKIFQEGIFLIAGIMAFQKMEKKTFLNAVALTSVICGVYGIIAYFLFANPYVSFLTHLYLGQESAFAYFLDESRGGMLGRAYGTMTHPLAWGQYWGMLLGFFLLNKNYYKKYIQILLPLIAIVNCFISGSRTALLMVFLTLCFWIYAKGIKIKWIICVSLCFLCSIPLVSEKTELTNYVESTIFFWDKDRESNNSVAAGSNMNMRQNQLDASLFMIKDSPLSGVGYDFQYYCIDHPGSANSTLMGFESIVFKKIVEQGVIGLIAFFFIVLALYKITIKYVVGRQNRILCIGFFIVSLMSFVFTGIQGHSWVYFFVFLLALHENGLLMKRNVVVKALSYDS